MNHATMDPIITTSLFEPIHVVSADMFGAIAVNSYGYNYFEEHSELLGLTNIRFPGGTVSEGGYVVDGRIRLDAGEISLETLQGDRANFGFDLTHPELISPLALEYDDNNHLLRDDVATFSQAMELAVERGVSLDLIIPVQRYFTGADFSDADVRALATDIARADVSDFLGRLKAGSFNNGEFPESITFEIGNEAYANPIEYALVARAMISEINAQLEGSDIPYEIAFQMGRGSYEFNNLKDDGYFDPFFDGSGDPIAELEELGFDPRNNMAYEDRQVAIDQMMISILGDEIEHIDAVRHHTLNFNSDRIANPDAPLNHRGVILEEWLQAFEARGIDREEVDYYVSAWSTNSADGNDMPYALAAAGNTLELFAYFMELGVDRAAIWGVVGAFRYKPDISSTVVTDRLSDYLSPQAAVVKMLSENVIDSAYLGSNYDAASGVVSYTFESDTTFDIFLSAEDFVGEAFTLELNFGLFSDLETVTVLNLDLEGGAANGASRLTSTEQAMVNGAVSVTFDQSHEIVMIKIDKDESEIFQIVETIEQASGSAIAVVNKFDLTRGSQEDDTLVGTNSSDIILGGAGNDVILGGGGHVSVFESGLKNGDFSSLGANNGDFIFGGEGDDVIHAYAGNDLLSGGAGNDELWGGSGFDTFIFSSGNDTIHDFKSGVDKVAIDTEILGGLSIEEWLLQFAAVEEDRIVLSNGTEDTLTILGVDTIEDLHGDFHVYDDVDQFVF